MSRALVLALLCAPFFDGWGALAARAPNKPSTPSPSAPSTSPSPVPAGADLTRVAFSVTVTPYHQDADGTPVDDATRRGRCLDMMNALNAEMTIRHVDGQLVYFVCGLEEGEENQNSHLQLTYMLQVAERNKTTSAAEKKWLKGVVQDAANASMRVTFKTVKKGNEKYVVGYCIKDEGLAHSVLIVMGLSEEEKAEARDVYIAKASDFDQAQSKMNKTPLKTIKKQVAFKSNNAFTLSGWFIAKHALVAVASSLTLPLTIAYAITTRNYRLDDSFVTGRTGAVLDQARTSAFFRLSMMLATTSDVTTLPTLSLVPLIETVLFGESQDYTMSPPTPQPGCLPTTDQLVHHCTLAGAKELARGLVQAPQTRSGRGIVIDFMAFVESAQVADHMRGTGLQVRTMFTNNQATNYQCGDNCAAWTCMLRMLGEQFYDLTEEAATAVNVPEHPRTQRPAIGKAADDTSWLTGDEIINLVALNNPDAPGARPQWLKGPAPLNYFYTYFGQSIVEEQHRGEINIMVVNTVRDSGIPSTTGHGGMHWFVAAWVVE